MLQNTFDRLLDKALDRSPKRIVDKLIGRLIAELEKRGFENTHNKIPHSNEGGLTIVAMPGFEELAKQLKEKVEAIGNQGDRKRTPVDIVVPEFGTRASGEPLVRLGKDHIGGHDCIVLTSGPGTYEMTGQLNYLLRYLVGRRANRICVVCAYFPLGRSDKDEGKKEFALPPLVVDLMMASTYNLLNRIISIDLHAPQVVMSARTGFITEVKLVRRILQQSVDDALLLSNNVVLSFPDESSVKRFEDAIEQVEEKCGRTFPIVYGAKRRKNSKEAELKRVSGDLAAVKDAIVLSIDDEMATGGTNLKNATHLKKKHGAKEVWGVVTHGILCGDAEKNLIADDSSIDRTYITDTVPVLNRPYLGPLIQQGKLIVIPWKDDLAWIVYYHHWNIPGIRGLR